MKPILGVMVALGALLASGVAPAQQPVPRYGLPPLWPAPHAGPSARPQGNPLDGQDVARGTEALSAGACVTCHGLDGAGDGSGAFPRLDGQHAWYLYKQLQDYASGARPHVAMTPIARALTDREMRDVAAWYAAQNTVNDDIGIEADLRLRQLGGSIAAVGAPDRGVTACVQCHGQRGEGMGPAIPALAGQYAAYTALQLRLWKRDERRNGPLGVMAQIAAGLTDAEIEAVAAYYATLPPDPQRADRSTAPARR